MIASRSLCPAASLSSLATSAERLVLDADDLIGSVFLGDGEADRGLPRRREARGAGLPCARRLAPRQDPASKPLVEGKNVTGFTDGEEEAVGLTKVVPFLVEDELLGLGAIYSKVRNWGVHVVTDGLLITGQNPASSGRTAKVLINALRTK